MHSFLFQIDAFFKSDISVVLEINTFEFRVKRGDFNWSKHGNATDDVFSWLSPTKAGALVNTSVGKSRMVLPKLSPSPRVQLCSSHAVAQTVSIPPPPSHGKVAVKTPSADA